MSARRTTIFVAGINPRTRARDLAYEFERYGRLVRCDIPAPRGSGRPFAFVEFVDSRDALDAYNDLHGARVDGHVISLQWARSPGRRDDHYAGTNYPSRSSGGLSSSSAYDMPAHHHARDHGRDHAPYPRGRSRSPVPRGRSRSPVPRGRSRSPVPRPRSPGDPHHHSSAAGPVSVSGRTPSPVPRGDHVPPSSNTNNPLSLPHNLSSSSPSARHDQSMVVDDDLPLSNAHPTTSSSSSSVAPAHLSKSPVSSRSPTRVEPVHAPSGSDLAPVANGDHAL